MLWRQWNILPHRHGHQRRCVTSNILLYKAGECVYISIQGQMLFLSILLAIHLSMLRDIILLLKDLQWMLVLYIKSSTELQTNALFSPSAKEFCTHEHCKNQLKVVQLSRIYHSTFPECIYTPTFESKGHLFDQVVLIYSEADTNCDSCYWASCFLFCMWLCDKRENRHQS